MTAVLIQNALLLALALVLLRRGRGVGVLRASVGTAGTLLAVGGLSALALAGGLGGGAYLPAFEVLGLFAWAPFVHLPLALLALGVLARRRHPVGALLAAGAGAALAGVSVWSFGVEPRWLEVTHHAFGSARIERPLRIVLLADVQTDRVGAYERRVLERAARLEPDLVLFAGDYVQISSDDPASSEAELLALREAVLAAGFAPRLGAFAVRGDVDAAGWQRAFDGTGVRALDGSETLDLGELRLTALSLADSRRLAHTPEPGDRFHVVLGHAPDFALGEVPADLLLAGHCHGGQVRLPFLGPPLTLSRIPRHMTSGAHRLPSGATLIVSRGIGLERAGAPPLRFNCRPELVVIDLLPRGDS